MKTYPSARSLAVAELTGDPGLSTLLATPNNILAVEYLKALKQQGSSMIPVTIRRRGCGYHDSEYSAPYASASAIRLFLRQSAVLESPETLRMQIPPAAFDALLKEGALAKPVFPDDLSELLQFRLLSAVHRKEDLNRFLDFSSDLAARLTRQVLHFAPFSEQIMQLKTKGYTYTRVSRALLHLLLDITKEQSSQAKSLGYAPYARILGFKNQQVRCSPTCAAEPYPTDHKNGRCQKTTFPGSHEGSGNRFLCISYLSISSGIPRKTDA